MFMLIGLQIDVKSRRESVLAMTWSVLKACTNTNKALSQ